MSDLMNNLTRELTSVYLPKAMLIAYQNEGPGDSPYFLEMRRILADGTIGAGMPVPYLFLNTIADNFSDSNGGIPHGALPENIWFSDSRRGAEKYIWSNPPRKRKMFFRRSLNIPEGEYHVPGVVYIAGESSLYVFAYKGKTLKRDSELYYGPFFNTTQGSVCLGTATFKKPLNPTYTELIDYWEKRFWMTEFTHLGGGGNPTKDNLVLVTKESAGKPFNEEQLVPYGKKLRELL